MRDIMCNTLLYLLSSDGPDSTSSSPPKQAAARRPVRLFKPLTSAGPRWLLPAADVRIPKLKGPQLMRWDAPGPSCPHTFVSPKLSSTVYSKGLLPPPPPPPSFPPPPTSSLLLACTHHSVQSESCTQDVGSTSLPASALRQGFLPVLLYSVDDSGASA